jgi:Fe-S-cluster containining protein
MIIARQTPVRIMRELGKECRKCGSCCSHGTGIVIEEDLPRMAKFLNISVDKLKSDYLEETEMFNTRAWKLKQIKGKKPFGPCVFLGKGKECDIHVAKPFHCSIANCSEYAEQAIQWFYLNYLVNASDPESVRQWASYLKHREFVIEGGQLEDLVPDRERLKKILNYGIVK